MENVAVTGTWTLVVCARQFLRPARYGSAGMGKTSGRGTRVRKLHDKKSEMRQWDLRIVWRGDSTVVIMIVFCACIVWITDAIFIADRKKAKDAERLRCD